MPLFPVLEVPEEMASIILRSKCDGIYKVVVMGDFNVEPPANVFTVTGSNAPESWASGLKLHRQEKLIGYLENGS